MNLSKDKLAEWIINSFWLIQENQDTFYSSNFRGWRPQANFLTFSVSICRPTVWPVPSVCSFVQSGGLDSLKAWFSGSLQAWLSKYWYSLRRQLDPGTTSRVSHHPRPRAELRLYLLGSPLTFVRAIPCSPDTAFLPMSSVALEVTSVSTLLLPPNLNWDRDILNQACLSELRVVLPLEWSWSPTHRRGMRRAPTAPPRWSLWSSWTVALEEWRHLEHSNVGGNVMAIPGRGSDRFLVLCLVTSLGVLGEERCGGQTQSCCRQSLGGRVSTLSCGPSARCVRIHEQT